MFFLNKTRRTRPRTASTCLPFLLLEQHFFIQLGFLVLVLVHKPIQPSSSPPRHFTPSKSYLFFMSNGKVKGLLKGLRHIFGKFKHFIAFYSYQKCIKIEFIFEILGLQRTRKKLKCKLGFQQMSSMLPILAGMVLLPIIQAG